MSMQINVQFEVRSMAIMKDTLKQLGYDYTEIENGDLRVAGQSLYRAMTISSNNINYDNMNEKPVNKIKQQYAHNFYRDQALKEGMQIQEKVEANGDIVMTLVHGS